jgi:hypothetical protein
MIIDTTNSLQGACQMVTTHFRCPEDFLPEFTYGRPQVDNSGFCRLGRKVGYAQCSSCALACKATDDLLNITPHVAISGSRVILPFDPVQLVNDLYNERYTDASTQSISHKSAIRSLYYALRPLMPVRFRKHLQRVYLQGWDKISFPQWPVDSTVESILEQLLLSSMESLKIKTIPFIWFWPDGARSCAIITHDVESASGRDSCSQLMDINDSFEIKSSFQVVPEERYSVSEAYLASILERGFELNVHDLNHDGLLYANKADFLQRTQKINSYGREWGALGFRSAVLYRNTDWYDALAFSYDMSIPNVAHLDPQRGGCCTVFPFFIGSMVELPVTATQDYSLFHILNDYSTNLWQEQISLIRKRHGLMSFIIHPDYIMDEKPRRVYGELLRQLTELRGAGETWIALPRDVVAWWRLRSKLTIVKSGASWKIEGTGSERARIAYASLVAGKLQYEV